MKEWTQAFLDQVVEWSVKVKRWDLWLVLLTSLIVGLLLGAQIAPTQGLTAGWVGLVIGAVMGAIATIFFERASKVIDQIADRRPLNRVLGPIARNVATIYVAPFARPLDTKLLRLDRTLAFDQMPPVVGTELVVGLGDSIALSFVYAALLKAGKRQLDIVINQNADLERGKWGLNFICIGAANARTREVLDHFQNTFFSFDDDFCAIVRYPLEEDVIAPITKKDGTRLDIRYRKKVILDDGKDYGLILKLKDEARDEGNRIIVLAGLGGDGTAGAAFYLWRYYDKLATLGDSFGVLIETTAGYESARMVDFDSVATLRSVQ